MEKKEKIGWLYCIAAFFVALGLFFVVKKDTYLFFALPIVLGVLLLYIFSLDKVLLLTSFCVPLSVVLDKFSDAGLAISLPAEPLLMGILVMFVAKMLYDGKYDRRIAHHPIAIVIYCMFIWMIVTTITSELPVVSIKFIASRLWFVVPSFFFQVLWLLLTSRSSLLLLAFRLVCETSPVMDVFFPSYTCYIYTGCSV